MVESGLREAKRFTAVVAGKEIVIETGKLAEQAGGAVTVQVSDTVLFAAATMSRNASLHLDFVPLTVEYEEKLYAAGRIPGSFFRREGRPAEGAILTGRVVDRTLRPLFPKDLRNEVQVIMMSLSHDQEHQIDMIGVLAASTALMISDIPWAGPVAGVRIGMIDGELVVNPTISEMENSTLDLRVSGTADAINMVECGAQEIDEQTMLKALALAHESIQPLIQIQHEMRAALGKDKVAYEGDKGEDALLDEVSAKVGDQVRQIVIDKTDREGRNEALEEVRKALVAEYEAHNAGITDDTQKIQLRHVREALSAVIKREVRRRITADGVRPDGRNYTQIRPLAAEVALIPRVHGSGLFTRGQTQVLSIATLGTPGDAQELDGVSPEDEKRYLHHYNMPPYSTG
ncbi:MAG TPA: polyribonucleotide nucleotidyltransferase, partial [Aggregatilineales bacterium]|nr:polyribonucleotide nucleotidyltransferase [Aggregatilineales bacterium]